MSGYFYAAPDAETLRALNPHAFTSDGAPAPGFECLSETGLLITPAVLDGDEVITQRVMSEPYVVLAVGEMDDWSDHLFQPFGRLGFA